VEMIGRPPISRKLPDYQTRQQQVAEAQYQPIREVAAEHPDRGGRRLAKHLGVSLHPVPVALWGAAS
jgi:hypothetical protein